MKNPSALTEGVVVKICIEIASGLFAPRNDELRSFDFAQDDTFFFRLSSVSRSERSIV